MTVTTAAVAREHHEPFRLERLHLDEPRRDEARVRMVASGVCHTDAIVREGVYPTPLPAVLGHEGAGIVEQVGAGVSRVSPGDHVVLSAAYCDRCPQCRGGHMAYCENLLAEDFGGQRHDGSTGFTDEAGTAISSHFFGQSSFAARANVVDSSLVPVDLDAPLEKLAPLGCGMQTGAGAVLNELRPPAGSSIAVSGTGAVGMAAIMAARAAGCTTIIAIDLHDTRLRTAEKLGATHTINAAAVDTLEELQRISSGQGVQSILDTTAIPAVLNTLGRAVSIRGQLALVGAAAPGTEASFEIGASLVRGWTFRTIVQGGSIPQEFIPRLVELWQQGQFPFDELIRVYELEEINTAFADSARGETIKPVVRFGE